MANEPPISKCYRIVRKRANATIGAASYRMLSPKLMPRLTSNIRQMIFPVAEDMTDQFNVWSYDAATQAALLMDIVYCITEVYGYLGKRSDRLVRREAVVVYGPHSKILIRTTDAVSQASLPLTYDKYVDYSDRFDDVLNFDPNPNPDNKGEVR